jgi:hypothetical protein
LGSLVLVIPVHARACQASGANAGSYWRSHSHTLLLLLLLRVVGELVDLILERIKRTSVS